MDEEIQTMIIDEAELTLRFFGFLTRRPPVPKRPAREVLAAVEAVAEADPQGHDAMAFDLASQMTKLAMQWFADAINAQAAAAGKGELVRNISKDEVWQ